MLRLREFVLLDPYTDEGIVLTARNVVQLAHRLRAWDRSAYPGMVPMDWNSAVLAATLLWNGSPVYLEDSEVLFSPGGRPLRRVTA